MSEATLDRARAGDRRAFEQLVDSHRSELHLHCYRMLGSLTEADDALQETLFAAWRGLGGYEQRASVRTWLYRIATNRCLNMLRDARRRPPPEPVPPFTPPEPSRRDAVTWLQPYPQALLDSMVEPEPGPQARYQAREAVELAFVAGLQRLPPRQTAVLLLRDVLGYSTAEVAGMLNTTETAVKGALQRARGTLDRRHPAERDGPPRADSAEERDLARRFADAFVAGDVEGVVALLTDDAWLTMPPAPHEYHGAAAVAAFLRASIRWRGNRRMRLVAARANTQPAFGCYLAETGSPTANSAGLVVLTLCGDRIGAVTRFLDPALTGSFGLPTSVPAGA